MNKVLCTFGWGEAEPWLRITQPKMEQYAEKHGYDMVVGGKDLISDSKCREAASWCKIPLFQKLFQDHDTILWLDADVFVCDGSGDVLDLVPPESNMALVKHLSNPYMWHPNCGVWVLNKTKTTLDILQQISEMPVDTNGMVYRMWEQGALLTLMGARPEKTDAPWPVVLPEAYNFEWHELPMEWNCSSSDLRPWPDHACFLHASTYANQKAMLLRSWKMLYHYGLIAGTGQ